MARNGSGNYALPNTVNPVVTDTTITSTWANTTLDDIATELTNSLPRDGQAAPTANLPMGGYKLTGLGNGSASTDSVTYGQVFSSPAFTGTPTAPTAAVGTNTPQIATMAALQAAAFAATLPSQTGNSGKSIITDGTTASWGVSGVTGGGTGQSSYTIGDILYASGATTLSKLAAGTVNYALVSGGAGVAPSWGVLPIAGGGTGQTTAIGALNALQNKGGDIASAATVDLDAATGDFVHVTGTTTITAITLASGDERTVVFDGALTLTHNATTLILPGGVNITTAAGDRAIFRGDGSGNVRCIVYTKASGQAIVSTSAASQAEMEAASSNTVMATPGTVNWHPGVAKAWIKCNAAGAIQASYNVTSITDVGVGQVTVTIATDFSSADYVVSGTCASTFAQQRDVVITSQSAGAFTATAASASGTEADPTNWFFACYGDQ